MCARKRREPKPVIPQKEVSIEEQWLNFATESFVGENFFTGEKKSAGGGRLRLDKYTLNRMLQNPCANYDKLQQISAWFEQTSGIYNRLLNYFTNMLTFDHVLMTNVPSSLISKYKKEIKESYDSSATLLQKIRVKDSLAKFSKDYWRDGEGYYYKIADKTGVVYQKIPNKICLPSKNTNGVLGFVVDMDALDSYDVTVFPKEIQKAYALFRINRKHEKFIFEKWFQISKNGFCFSNNEDGHGTPPLLFLFKDLLGLEDTKDLQDKLDKLNNIKMIHNKIEKDKEGRIAVDPKVAQRYVGAIKENLKQRGLDEGFIAIANPFEAKVLQLDAGGQKMYTIVDKKLGQLLSDVGVSQMLFNSDKASAEALKKSIIVDSVYVLSHILKMFENYINFELSNISSKHMCKILDNTYFNQDERRESAKEDLGYGGSKFVYLASCGFTPLESQNILATEKLLGLNNLFVPIETSHTQSGKDKKGRPSTDDTKKMKDSTENVKEGE